MFEYRDGGLYRRFGGGGRAAGSRAGGPHKEGYRVINLDGVPRLEHRLIWTYHFGPPTGDLDHVNGDRTDNRIENLRECTQTQNNANSALRADSTSGHKGVSYRRAKKVWRAYITTDGRQRTLGHFPTRDAAIAAYRAAALAQFGSFAEFRRGSDPTAAASAARP